MDEMMTGAPAPAAQPQGMAGPGEVEATPEENALNEEVVAKAMMVIYDKAFFPQVLDMLESEDPKEGLAKTAAMVMLRILQTSREAGREIPGDVMMNAGKEVYEQLADVSERFGFIDFDADPEAFEGGYFLALDEFRVMAQEAGLLDMEAIDADFAELAAADGGAAPPPQAVPPRGLGGAMPPGGV